MTGSRVGTRGANEPAPTTIDPAPVVGQAVAAELLAVVPPGARGAGSVQARAVIALQRSAGNRTVARVLARDLAVEPTVPNPAPVSLTPAQLRASRLMNAVLFTDAAEIAVIRDVLGLSRTPSVVDDDFTTALASYQASVGLTSDGKLGPLTSDRLGQELTAEADSIGDPARGTELRRTARRLHLRSMTSRTQGTYASQGFVGPDDNPTGSVTVRLNDSNAGASDFISLEYTGEDSSSVHWLQLVNMQMFATPPGAASPVFRAGSSGTSSGPVAWSSPGSINWHVDAVAGSPAASPSPFYDVSGFTHDQVPGRRAAMLDDPGGPSALPAAQAFAAAGAAAGATSVTFSATFSTYLVKGNRARYRVDWTATTTYDITAGTAGPIGYRAGFAGSVAGLRTEHHTALISQFAGSPIT